MKICEQFKNEFFISDDKNKLDSHFIHAYLCNESYWAKNIPLSTVKKSIDGSLCFGLYEMQNKNISATQSSVTGFEDSVYRQIGFARVVTDHATFAYLADVFIAEEFRGRGLAVWLMEVIMQHAGLQGLRRWLLATKDAHALYTRFGFTALDKPERVMGFKPFEEYPQNNS
jgi:ribosomal protein S18 acetylase RimI-like enzyme